MNKSLLTQNLIHKYFENTNYYIHKSEGAIFLWILLEDLSITTKDFYQILKQKGVFVMPGEYFFFGNTMNSNLPKVEDHPHFSKCLRLNYGGSEEQVEYGIKIISELYKQNIK